MTLKNEVFVEKEGKKIPLVGVYHAKTWEHEKVKTEDDFKSDGIQRVVIATCALGMGVNFPNVKFVVNYGPPQTVTELVQQSGRAGRNGQQAYSIVYGTNRKLSEINKELKKLLMSDSCLRVGLYGYFNESVTSQMPAHSCCSKCRMTCHCNEDGTCGAIDLHYKSTIQDIPVAIDQECSGTPRNLSEIDRKDLKSSLEELKEQYSCGVMSIFHEETSHGFSHKLIEESVEHSPNILSGAYLTENLGMYSSRHAIDVLTVLQEIFEDIEQFDTEMDALHLVNKEVLETDSYLLANSLCLQSDAGETSGEDFVLPEFDLQF